MSQTEAIHVKSCLKELEDLRKKALAASTADELKLARLKSEFLAKELSAIRLLQGYDRLQSKLTIAVIGLVSGLMGGGVSTFIFEKFLKQIN